MNKVLLFIAMSAGILVYLYNANTSSSKQAYKQVEERFISKRDELKKFTDVNPEDKKRIDYYFQIKSSVDVKLAIHEYQSTTSLGLKSAIINTMMNFKFDDQMVRNFAERLLKTGDDTEANLILKHLAFKQGEYTYNLLKDFLLSGRKIEDDSYAQVIVALAQNAPVEEKAAYIEKLRTIVDTLAPISQRNVLKVLLELTDGSEEIIDLINRKLNVTTDLSMEIFAMTTLSKYDSSWLDQNREKLMKHPNPGIRSTFIQNLKYYCPNDLWEVMEGFLEDPDKDVRMKLLREMVSYGKRSLPFFEKNKSKFNLDTDRVEGIIATIKKGSFDSNNYCPDR